MNDYSYLEGHPGFHFVPEHRRYALVEVLENAHGQLRLDAARGDQVIEGVGEGETDAVRCDQYLCSRTFRGKASLRGAAVEFIVGRIRSGRHVERNSLRTLLSVNMYLLVSRLTSRMDNNAPGGRREGCMSESGSVVGGLYTS